MRIAAVAMVCNREAPGVRTVEEAVKSVMGRIYDKFHLVPDELLRIADHNPDYSATHHHQPTPPSRTTASSITGAVYAKCEPVAKELYASYEAKAAVTWQRLSPRAACWREKGSRVWTLVAMERIAKMLTQKRL